MPTTTQTIAQLLPYCTVTRGWHLAGVGPARYGYGATTASGQCNYLGRTADEAIARAEELGQAYGSARQEGWMPAAVTPE